jgi:pre-mRNA-splicing helicase BRR2
VTISVTLDREADENDPDDQVADAPHFPHRKMVSWWLVVGDPKTKQLYAIKKVTVKAKLETKLDFTLPEGDWALKLYLICDSYSGADQDFDLETLKVAEGESSDEEDSDDAMDED